jgi:site-specific recombinase XerD
MTTPLVPVSDPAADPLRELVLGWLAGKRSVHTRRAYARDLAGWLDWCADHDADPLGAAEPLAASWARHLEADSLAASTVARKLAAASSWYDWLTRGGRADANPFARLDRPVVDRHVSATPGLTRDQAMAMIAAADVARGPQLARTSALIAALLLTGTRVGEVTGADIEDLGTDRGHRVLWVTRKGGKRQPLVLPAPAADRVDAYLAGRDLSAELAVRKDSKGRRVHRVLFATASGSRMLPADVWRLVRRIARAAKLPDDLVGRMGPHAMRHSFATLYLDSGGSLRDLQDAMGHADPATTRRYDRARNSLDRSPGYALAAYLGPE